MSAGVGGMATRGAMWAGGRVLAGRGATAAVTNAATRQFATSMTGRVIGGIAGGAANFGTFEGIKEMETQFAHGGHIVGQDDTGRYLNEGNSASAVAGQAAHGFLMGGAIGWLTPVSGNVADKLVRSTSSTGLKVMERAGVYSGATMLEGTIFSVPEWIEGNRDAMDVWTDNMAMMVGFKAKHMIKSAGNVLGDLKASFDSPTNGRKNRLDFESRLRQRMDAPSDGGLSLTKDEAAELSKHGYGDLRELVESAERTGDATKGELITANAPEIVSRLTDMVTDPRISEAARAKMYYYATGRKLPESTVMKGELIEDGEGGFIVESQGANGVITSRSFKSRKAADLELERIKRQTELNHIEIGERYQQTADFENRLQEACRTVAAENGWDMVEVYRTCEEARRNNLRGGDKQFDEAQQNILRKVTEAMGEFEETSVTDNMRGRINDKYGVDIDNAIRKEANRRTIAEQTAIDEYLDELIPKNAKERNTVEDAEAEDIDNAIRKEANRRTIAEQTAIDEYLDELIPKNAKERNTVEDAEAEDITNQKLLTDEPEATTPTNDAPIDPRFDNPTTPEYDPHQPGGEQKPVGRAVMKYQDRPVEVLSGRVVMMEDGTMIDNERSDASIVVRDLETGKVEMVSPDAILSYEGYPAEVEVPQDNVAPEAETPAEPQPKYTTGQIKIRNSDGTETRGVLTGFVDENGNHEYYVEGDLQQLHYASEHELDNILSEYTPDEPQEVKQPQPAEPQPVDPNRPTQEGVANVEDYDKGYSFGIDETQGISDSELTAKISELRTDAERLTDFGRGMLEAYEYEQQRRAMEQQLVPVDAETVPKTEETTLNPMETGVNITETVPKTEIPIENVQQSVDDGNVVVPAPATNEAPQVDNVSQPDLTAQAEPTPLQRIPRNEKNEPIFEQAESPEVGWDALVEFSEGDAATAKEIADTMVEEKRKAFEKAQKLKPKGKTPTEILASKKANTAELTKAQAEYEQWQRMAGVENARQSAIRSQQEVEARRLAAERAEAEKAEREAREEAARLEREALEGIPEWHMDTPENARKRGVRRFSGQMFTRQEPVQGVVGNEVEVKFSQKDLPKGRVAVIEASQLQPSHVQGQRNPMFFIEEAQPKNRTEAVSMFAAKEMAEGIRPKEITGSVTAYTGAPTVNTRGEVIQGNNRSDALRYLWQSNLPQQQQTYKQYLIDNAEQFGIDPEAVNAMQNPVLVNMLDVDDAEAIRLGQMTAQDTESGGIERIKPKNVAQTLGDNMRTFANMLLSSDKLPAKAQRAILATAFRDMDSPFAGKMLPEIQASIIVYNQLMSDPTFANAKKMEEVLKAVEAFKQTIALDDRFEHYMPADNFSNFALHLAAMYKATDMSQATIASYFNQMYDLAQGKKAATLFDEADTTEYPLAEVINQVLNFEYQPAKNGNNDVANGGADVALRNQVSQGGELRGNEPPASGEQTPTGTEPSDSGAGASDDSSTAGVEAVEGETPQSTDAAAITGEGYKVEPKPYTNKQGKTLDTYLVTFDRDFSKEELSTLRAKAKALKGWYDRETRGWMLRGADDAKAFAKDIVGKSEDEVADEAPLSLADMEKPASDKPKKAPVNRVNVEGVMADLYTKGETKLSDHAEPVEPTQTKPKKRRWISDEDADEFNNLRDNLRNHFGKGDDIVQERMDAEVLRMGTRMTYLMMKGGLRSFADYCEAMIDELPDIFDDMRPHLKSLYAAAQNMEEVIELGWDEEMDDRKTVKAFDVYNFDKPGAKDIIATSQHIVDEQSSQQHTDQIIQTLKDQRNEQRKKEADETSADTEAIADKAEAVASKVESELEVATTEQDAERLSRDLDKEIEDVNKQLALLGYYEAENNSTTPKNNSHEKTDVQARPETAGRGGQQPRPNEPLGTSAEHEAERTDGGRMAQRGGVHTVSDTKRGTGVSDQHKSERGVAQPKNIRNNHAERGVDYAPKGEKARIDANLAAIEVAKKLLASGETATPKEMEVLRRYSGWGGLGSAFNEGSTWSPNPINKRLREILTPEEYEAAVMSRNSAYYTPAPVIDAMWDIAKALGFKGGNIVEGSAGIGNIIGLMPTEISERSNIHAVEIDNTTGGILSLLYPDAKVEVQGFEKTRIANGSVDLAITNVPFVTGLHVMDESGDSDLSKKFRDIHDFCIAKNVRKLREGGIGIFITSSGTLDKSQKLRNWLVGDKEGCADVVGVFRMNNQTFGGTAATSDIIVVRKRVNGRKSANAIDISTVTPVRTASFEDDRGKTKDLPMLINRYFIEHPEYMGGEMFFGFEQGDTYRPTSMGLFPTRTADQPARMAAWVQHIAEMDWSKEQGTAVAEQTTHINEALGKDVKEGSMVTDSNGNLCVARMGSAVPLTFNKNKIKGRTKEQCFADYTDLKNALADVLKYQTEHNDDAGLQPLLDRLNSAYDTFVARYGNLNKNNNLAWLRNDVDFSSIVALETYSEKGSKDGTKIKTYGKTDIFSRRVVEKESEPAPKNVKDGIIASLYKYGRIDPEYLASQLGKSQADVKQEIIESGLGFENPTTGQMEVSYEYLSGNVREKLRQAREANEAANGAYDANIKALEAVVPMNIPAHLIEFTLGSSWVDPKLYERFVKERTDLNVRLTNAGGTWHMSEPYWTDEPKNKEMGIRSESLGILIPGHKLIEAAITNKTITVSKTTKNSDGTTTTETDAAATTACATKVDEIRQDFKDWAREQMQNDPELSMRMEEVYNEKFNNSVPKSIPDEFVPEHFGGAATMVGGRPFRLRPHQAKAVIRATTQPVLLAHEVGTGKTYTLITTAMEMRRLGTARKPMIVVQNATVGQFVASAKALYPNAKVLTLEDADRNAEGRKAFYAKIKFNDWDMIVVPQSVFERIPDSVERQTQFIQDKIEEKLLVLDQMKDADPDGRSMIVRAAEREIEKLKDEISQLANGGATDKKKEKDAKKAAVTRQNAEVKAREMLDRATDDVEDFDSMGIDAILVDEAHEYKHLGFATAMQRGVKGVDPSFSKKSQGVFLKTQSVLEKTGGKNVVFATGTPISNTAAEIWTFMRYLMSADVMKDYGIYYFDDFVRNFGNLQQMLEFSTSGKYKENNRFAGYVNLPELVRIWSTVADTVLTREAGGVSDKIPQMEGGKAQDIFLPQTRALRSIMKFVKEQLDAYDNMSGKEKKENSHIPLVMYGIAKAAAVDARLVQSDAEDDPNSKTNEAVRQTLRTLEEAKDYNGTVAIFADNYQNKVSGFNLYEDIRKKLISAGVPEEQIVVMKSGMTVNKKLEIFSRVNAGEVRVIMGSTFTLGTGVNIQERLHTLIHLDAPNRPMDYTQRNGRILRQGNLHNEWGIPVRVLRFGVEDSLDVTAYQRLKTKGAIADSIMNGKQLMENSMENRALEEDQDLFGDITAQLSGSEYAMLKNQIEKEVRKLTAQRKSWEADQTYIHNRKRQIAGQNKEAEKRIAENKSYLEKVEAATVGDITVDKLSYPSVEAMEDFFTEQNKRKAELQEQVRKSGYSSRPATSDITISVGGFNFHVHTEINRETKQGQQGDLFYSAPAKMTYSCPELGIEAMPVKGNVIKNAVTEILNDVVSGEDFRGRIEAAERSIERNNAELQSISARDGVPFKFTEELAKAEEKLSEYEDLMKAEMEAKEAKYAELDKEVEAASNIELTEEDSEDAASEPIASYSEENANFASRYETQDGKTINYTSENAEGYGGLFDFDFSGENAGGNEVGMRSGANDLQRQGDTGLNRHNSRLDKEAGEFSLIERVFRESGSFNFTSGEKIESADDVAFIFSALEDAAKEHSFVVLVKDGKPTVVELGMGTFTATMVDIPTASLAYNRIQPDQVYFVHNHPSGNLMCSPQDVQMLRKIADISKVPVHGVIINLKTGKYGTFDTDNTSGVGQKRVPENESPLAVHTLDKQIFAPNYDPMEQPLVRGSEDVAKFLNSQRMGDRAKMSFIILSRAGRIVGNIHTPFTKLPTKSDEIARYISERVIQFGGESAILYGDFTHEGSKMVAYRNLKDNLNKVGGTTLLDVVNVEGNNTRSANDDGLLYELGSEYGASTEAKSSHAERMSKKFNTPIRIVTDTKELTNDNSERQARMRRSKGFYDPATGEVVIVLPNNANVEDVAETVFHEVVAHKGLREMIGEENYDAFCDEIYNHLKDDLKQQVEEDATRRFVNEPGKEYEHHRRVAVDEMFGRMSEKGFEDFTKAERGIWVKLKAKVLEAINKFLGSLKLPKWVKLGDNELRYMLWRSHEKLRTKGDYVDMARDAAKRDELGLSSDARFRDGETSDIWKDQSIGLEERITNAAIRLSNNQSADLTLRNDAMRAVTNNLQSLLHSMRNRRGTAQSFVGADRKVEAGVVDAMNAQAMFDRSTVKRVSDLARILMQNGYLSGMTSGEMQRLLSAVKNATAMHDIADSVQKIMDIMVDNQLRNGEASLRQLLAIRGSKVDARGVEVQGALDVDGQHTMEVVKKAISLTEDDITDRIAEAMNRMSDPDQTIADQAAIEYAGLNMALDYVQNIANSKAEEKALRDSLKIAKEDRDAGRMTDDAYKQFIETTEDAIRKNKIERTEAYFNLVGRLSDSLRGSIENAKAFREAEKARISEIHHNANSDMEGRPTNEHHKDDWQDKFVNNGFVQFLFAPLGTFDQIMRVFGNKSANGEGYLWNRFMRGWVDCRNKELRGIKDKFAQLDEKAAELFGKSKTWGDIIRMERKLPKASVSFWDGGEMRDHELTQGNLLYIYMVDKMTDGRMKLRRMGITEQNVADIENFLDPRFKALGDWLQDDFLVATRNEYNETHKRMFGASMAAIENYFPLKILANARVDKEEDVNQQNRPDGITTKTGSIIKRRVNNLALDITGADALSVILDHITQMEHWSAYAEWNRDLNTLRTYKRFRNQVINMTTVYGGGRRLWENFNDLCLMAAGEYRPPVSRLNKNAVNLAKGVTAAKVSFRLFTALKQFLSAPAYAPEVNLKSIAKSIANPYGDFKWCLENLPIFRERWHSRISGDPRLLKSDMDWKMWRSRVMEISSRIGMTPNAFVDAVTVSIGARAMYETRLNQYLKEGYPADAAEKRAMQDATILFNQTQQSSESPFLSTMQVDKDWLSTLFTVFRNSSMSYTRQTYDGARNLKRNLTSAQRAKSVAFMTKQILRDWEIDPESATDDEYSRANDAARKRFRRQIKKDVIRLATFGYVLEWLWNLGPYLPYIIFGYYISEKDKMWDDVITHSYFGSIEGLTGGDVMSSFGNMWASGEWSRNQLSKDMPLASDINTIANKFIGGKNAEAVNDILNLLVQSGIGMNPQSLTDAAIAITDACGDDPALSHEAAIFVMRVLQVPQSQLDKLYFDEIGLNGEEASKLTPQQLAARYAEYKVKRGTPLAPWFWGDEERLGKYEELAKDRMTERLESRGDAAVKEAYADFEARYKAVNEKAEKARAMIKTDYAAAAQAHAALQQDPDFTLYQRFGSLDKQLGRISKMWLTSKTPEEAALIASTIPAYRAGMVKVLQAETVENQQSAMSELTTLMNEFYSKYQAMQPQSQQLNR